jgi:hypothetical protein
MSLKTGDATAQHLGARQQGAIMDELRRRMPCLGRPDMILQPLHQRQIVGEAAQQGHRRVRVQIHQPRQQHVLRQVLALARHETAADLGLRHDGNDASSIDDDGMPVEHRSRWLDGNDPARLDHQIDYRQARVHRRRTATELKKTPLSRGFSAQCAGLTWCR